VLGQEGDHLATDLHLWDIAVKLDAIQAIDVENDMTREHIIDVEHLGHGGSWDGSQIHIQDPFSILSTHSPHSAQHAAATRHRTSHTATSAAGRAPVLAVA